MSRIGPAFYPIVPYVIGAGWPLSAATLPCHGVHMRVLDSMMSVPLNAYAELGGDLVLMKILGDSRIKEGFQCCNPLPKACDMSSTLASVWLALILIVDKTITILCFLVYLRWNRNIDVKHIPFMDPTSDI